MIKRFSLYGFLKNQRYFEPFLVLVFLEKGLSFFQIGLLIGFREIAVTLMEVPSGAWADIYGRKRAMLVSFSAYIGSFLLFASAETLLLLTLAMALYAVGDVFRSGTHKAIIFHWLKLQNRMSEKTEVYGYTRSWSRLGSALAVVIAPILVFFWDRYSVVFFAAILPYLGNMLNLSTYPQALDRQQTEKPSQKSGMWRHFKEALGLSFSFEPLRRLLIESAGYEGLYKAQKDYLQPILQTVALAMPILLWVEDRQRTAILIGAVYVTLHLGSAWAARKAHRLRDVFGSETAVSRALWLAYLLIFGSLLPALYFQWHWIAITGFVAMAIAQNFWRPVLISRIGDYAPEEQSATVLSIESQTRGLAAMIFAPSLGWALDHWGFWPLGALGLLLSSSVLLVYYRPKFPSKASA